MMKIRPVVAAIAAGSLLLGNVAAFAQAEEAQRRAQEQQEARERGYYHPSDPANPRPGAVTRMHPSDPTYPRAQPGSPQARAQPGYPQGYGHRSDPRYDQRYDQRHDQRYDQRNDARYDPRYYQRWDSNQRRYVPGDRWGGDWRGRGAGPEHNWYRGGYLPREYRGRHYVVDDWRGHHLYAPPSGYHWVQSPGGDYVLAAIATGLIAAILLNQ